MTSCTIVPLLVALLAPAPAEPSDAASTPAPVPEQPVAAPEQPAPDVTSTEPAPAGEPAPSEAEPPPDATLVDPMTPVTEAPTEAPPSPAPGPLPPSTENTRALVTARVVPRPIRWRLDFGVNLGGAVIQDLGYRAFAERRHLPEFGTSALFDFRLAEGRFFLGGGVGYDFARHRGDAYGSQVTTRVQLHEPRVLGRLSFMTIEGIDVFARVGVGPSIADLEVDGTEQATQRVVLPRVDGQAGLSLYLPKQWLARKQASRVAMGLQLGVGYTWRGTIDARPTLEQGDEPLRATASPLGELSLHGVSWGMGLFLRVM